MSGLTQPIASGSHSSIKNYTNENVQNAVQSVLNGQLSFRKASKKYGVPVSTIHSKVKNKSNETQRPGPKPFLTHLEERSIVKWIIVCSKRGHPRTPLEVRLAVKRIIDQFPRENPFKENVPSYNWYKKFLKRHNDDIKARKPEALSMASSHVTDKDLFGWWHQIDDYFHQNNLIEIFNDPRRVLNCDESKIDFNANPGKVIVEKQSKNSYMAQSSGNKTGCTVLHTISADGSYIDPFVIFPYARAPEPLKVKMSQLQNIDYNYNVNGWMTEQNFLYYLEFVLVKSLKQKGVPFPVILFMDNHSSHVTMEVSKLADSLGIILVALYPNSTHVIQPLDCAVFRGLKANWSNLLLNKRVNDPNFKVNMMNFAELFLEMLSNSHNADAVINGFKVCGLYPWKVENMDCSKLLTSNNRKIPIKELVVFSEKDTPLSTFETHSVQSSNEIEPCGPDLFTDTSHFDENETSCGIFETTSIPSSNAIEPPSPDIFTDTHDSGISETLTTPLVSSETIYDQHTYTLFDENTSTSFTSPEVHNNLHSEQIDVINVTEQLLSVSEATIEYIGFDDETVIGEIGNDLIINNEPIDLSMKNYTCSNNQSEMSSDPKPIIDESSHQFTFNKLKELYGPSKFKVYNNSEYEPTNTDQDLLMRILHFFRPKETANDVLELPPINKRMGIKATKKQPFIISSTEFRQFRSINEREKNDKKRKKEEEKENARQIKKKKMESKTKEELEKKKKLAVAKMEKQILNAEKQAALKLRKLN